jgi:hypothetical protein
MFWNRRVTCGVCHVEVPRSQTRRTLERGFAAVCHTCYERWNRSGRLCAKCHTMVGGPQQPGLLVEASALGHADCGGALLAA